MNKKGGLADSPFFVKPQSTEAKSLTPKNPKAKPQTKKITTKQPRNHKSKRDTMTPRHRDTSPDTMIPRHHDLIQEDVVELVRKAVKEFGKEAATHRFTLDEKRAIADIIYSYKGHRIKTNENEITRIAVNFIISDYQQNGEDSVLHKVIKALNL